MPNQQQDNRGNQSGAQGGKQGGQGDDNSNKSGRGFASMDDEQQREIASEGGKASGGNFKNDPQKASEAGRKGGQS